MSPDTPKIAKKIVNVIVHIGHMPQLLTARGVINNVRQSDRTRKPHKTHDEIASSGRIGACKMYVLSQRSYVPQDEEEK